MHTNRLAAEKSPYLLQHAHNPVDWHAWGPEAFEKARAENKPIFLSIGYSTCHWCHVMERESFENERIAEILNREFVAIKVDREERPDVDRIYMSFVQAATGGGGWPMSVWLTPDRKPFFGGTYFPPENRWGHPGFASVLTQIATAWHSNRDQIVNSAGEALLQLERHTAVEGAGSEAPPTDDALLDSGFSVFRRTFDSQAGGFGDAPKFPRPSVLEFLLRYYSRTGNQEALEMVLVTLRAMAKGGMHDQLGGGFHRYSVDERWFVPHFEKMLYDQAQLARAYLEAYQITHDTLFADIARRIFDYVLRDLTGPEGGFFSAEDADSVISPDEPERKGEGAFYIWSAEEIREVVPAPAAEWFCYRYGVADGGNVANDPHGEFEGRNILYQAADWEELAEHAAKPLDVVRAAVFRAEQLLLAARSRRIRPHLDDKILTAWNGLMISAFALGGAVLDEPRYAEAACRAAAFVTARLYHQESGILLRRYRDGSAAISAFLDDYAAFIQALLDLYETQFDLRHLEFAARLAQKQRELFEDAERGGFFSSAADDASLVLRLKEDYDGAEPSGNSMSILNFLRLARLTNQPEFLATAEKALSAFAPQLSGMPFGLPYLLAAFEFYRAEPRQAIVVGDRDAPDTRELLRVLHSHFAPNCVSLLLDSPVTRQLLARSIPEVAGMQTVDGRAAAYVCRNYACELPVCDPARFSELLQ